VAISFHVKHPEFKVRNSAKIKNWINRVLGEEGFTPGPVSFIFVTNQEILEMNQNFLKHDYFTDIITFDYVEGRKISGDIFISIDTVKENSSIYSTAFDQELLRVIIHGILHLCGYKDSSGGEITTMRKKEDYYLAMYE
jgi:probable rRNA maturation factor